MKEHKPYQDVLAFVERFFGGYSDPLSNAFMAVAGLALLPWFGVLVVVETVLLPVDMIVWLIRKVSNPK